MDRSGLGINRERMKMLEKRFSRLFDSTATRLLLASFTFLYSSPVYILLYPQSTTRPNISASPMTSAATRKPVSQDPALILASTTVLWQFDAWLKSTGLFVATNTITQTPQHLFSNVRHQESQGIPRPFKAKKVQQFRIRVPSPRLQQSLKLLPSKKVLPRSRPVNQFCPR